MKIRARTGVRCVTNKYRAPIELFDRHLYEKGSLVLHMLRRTVGDELFFKSLNLYCTRHRGHNVITQDLQRAFEDATGRNLDFFFDQWVYKEGHPELEISSALRRQAEARQRHHQADAQDLGYHDRTVSLPASRSR